MFCDIYINERDGEAVTWAPVADQIGFQAVECLFERIGEEGF